MESKRAWKDHIDEWWSLDARSESRTGSSLLGTGEKRLEGKRASLDARSGRSISPHP
jgi:uncharacterized protein (DUF1499 family)